MHDNHLFLRLARRLREALERDTIQAKDPAPGRRNGYAEAFRSLARKLPALERQVARHRARADARWRDILEAPAGRVRTLLENSPPATLVALAYEFMRRSYANRFGDATETLRLAELGLAAARAAAGRGYLAPASEADLIGEALLYHANARRLAANIRGAQASLTEADAYLRAGTRDRGLRADWLGFLGALRVAQRRLDDGAACFEREIRLRRLERQTGRLGAAWINLGWARATAGDIRGGCAALKAGLPLVEDHNLAVLALMSVAEAVARTGDGLQAWRLIRRAEAIAQVIDSDSFEPNIDWIKGLALMNLGQLAEADRLFAQAQARLADQGKTFKAALASLDRACVLIRLRRTEELHHLTKTAYDVFTNEGLDERALAAFMVLHQAVREGQAGSRLTVNVANFVIRSRYDRNLRIENQTL